MTYTITNVDTETMKYDEDLQKKIFAETGKMNFDVLFPKNQWYAGEVRKAFPGGKTEKSGQNWMTGCLDYLGKLQRENSGNKEISDLIRSLKNAKEAMEVLQETPFNAGNWNFALRNLIDCSGMQKNLDAFQKKDKYEHMHDPQMQAVCGMIRGFQDLSASMNYLIAEQEMMQKRKEVEETNAVIENFEKQELQTVLKEAEAEELCLDPQEIGKEEEIWRNKLEAFHKVCIREKADLQELKNQQNELQQDIDSATCKVDFMEAQQDLKEYAERIGTDAIQELTQLQNEAYRLEQCTSDGAMNIWKRLRNANRNALTAAPEQKSKAYEELRRIMREEHLLLHGRPAENNYRGLSREQIHRECGFLMDTAKYTTKYSWNRSVRNAVNAYDDADTKAWGLAQRLRRTIQKEIAEKVKAENPQEPEEVLDRLTEDAVKRKLSDFLHKLDKYYEKREEYRKTCRDSVTAKDLDNLETAGWNASEAQLEKAREDKKKAGERKAMKEEIKKAINSQEQKVQKLAAAEEDMKKNIALLQSFREKLTQKPKNLGKAQEAWKRMNDKSSDLNTIPGQDLRIMDLKNQIMEMKENLDIKEEESHHNSTEYRNMKTAVEAFAAAFSNDAVPDSKKLSDLRRSTEAYLEAKAHDWHVGSGMRYRRLALAQQILAFAERFENIENTAEKQLAENQKIRENQSTGKENKKYYGAENADMAELLKQQGEASKVSSSLKFHEKWNNKLQKLIDAVRIKKSAHEKDGKSAEKKADLPIMNKI